MSSNEIARGKNETWRFTELNSLELKLVILIGGTAKTTTWQRHLKLESSYSFPPSYVEIEVDKKTLFLKD